MGKKYTPIIKKGTHLASVKGNDGTKYGALLDDVTNKVVGQAQWKEVDDDDYSYSRNSNSSSDSHNSDLLGAAAVGAVATVGVIALVAAISKAHKASSAERQEMLEKEKIREEIRMEEYRQQELLKAETRIERERMRKEKRKQRNAIIKKYLELGFTYFGKGVWITVKYMGIAVSWFVKKTFTGIKTFSIWAYRKIKQRISENKSKKIATEMAMAQSISETSINLSMTPEKFTSLVDEAFEEFQRNMTSEEAQIHLLKIFLLSNELAKEIRSLSHVGIFDTSKLDTEYKNWQKAMEKLTTNKMVEYINYILMNNGENLEPAMMDSLIKDFHGKMYVNQGFVPICQENIQEALRLY